MKTLKYLAAKAKPFGIVDQDDMFQDGAVALLRARERFDPARGVAWPTYAAHRARGGMLDALRDVDHLPRLMRARLKAAGQDGVKVLSLDGAFHKLTENGGVPRLLDGSAEGRDFWASLKRRVDARTAEILTLYFSDGLKLWEIGDRMELSESRVCQLFNRGLARLRETWRGA